MKKGFDIHNYKNRYKNAFEFFEKREMNEENKETIKSFLRYCEVDGIGLPRRERYLNVLPRWSDKLDCDFRTATKDDIIRVVSEVQNNPKLKPYTIATYKAMLKRFYKWLLGNDEEYPDIIKWIKCKIKKHEIPQLTNEELLTEEEVMSMIQNADHPRDKALIAVVYESGCRIGEIGSLQLENVHIDEHGAKLEVKDKTELKSVFKLINEK